MIPLTDPYFSEDEIKEVMFTLKSKKLTQDEKVKMLEEKLCEYLGVKHVIAVSSGTAALHLTMLALKIGEGDEVIIPDFTFPATANVVELTKGRVIPVDISLNNFCIDVDKIENKITRKTRAIIVVHQFGNVPDMDKLIEMKRKYGLWLIEDAACAIGSLYKGKKVGTFGDVACFSFHPRKVITTGEGGFIATNNSEIADRIRILRNHGFVVNFEKPFERELLSPGLNYRMTELQAALGIVQLSKLNEIIDRRREVAELYLKHLEKYLSCNIEILPYEGRECFFNYQSFFVVLNEKISRNAFISYMLEHGIQSTIGSYAIHALKYYREKYNYADSEYYNSLKCYLNGIVLPIYPNLSKSDILKIIKEVDRFFNVNRL